MANKFKVNDVVVCTGMTTPVMTVVKVKERPSHGDTYMRPVYICNSLQDGNIEYEEDEIELLITTI